MAEGSLQNILHHFQISYQNQVNMSWSESKVCTSYYFVYLCVNLHVCLCVNDGYFYSILPVKDG